MSGEVDINPESNALANRAAITPRAGWAMAFQEMSDCGDDALLEDQSLAMWDEVKWQW